MRIRRLLRSYAMAVITETSAVAVIAAVGLVGCLALAPAVAQTTVAQGDLGERATDNLAAAARGVSRIVAHRGSSLDRPENTAAAIERAIEAGATAVEIDVRTSRDGHLVVMHDATVDRTTDGTGRVNDLTLAELAALDAGSWFDAKYAGQRVLTLAQALQLCRERIDVQLDLKEEGQLYAERVAAAVQQHGQPQRTTLAVRSVAQSQQLAQRLPAARRLAFVKQRGDIAAHLAAGIDLLRPRDAWLAAEPKLLDEIRAAGAQIHLDATTGTREKTIPLLAYRPESLLCDDPAQLTATLSALQH